MGFSTGKKLLVTKRNMRSGSGALSTWGTNLQTSSRFPCYTRVTQARSFLNINDCLVKGREDKLTLAVFHVNAIRKQSLFLLRAKTNEPRHVISNNVAF